MQTLKSFFLTALVLGAAFLAYDYFLAQPGEKMVFKKPASTQQSGAGSSAPVASTVATTDPVPQVAPPPVAPVPVTPVPQAAPPPVIAPPIVSENAFTPPPIPGVAQATANWTRIPATAFPRQVKLVLPVAFKAAYGSTQMPAGTEVTALAMQNGFLLLAPTPTSPARASVTFDTTDLKATLTTAYNAWREKRIEEARIAWKNRDQTPVASSASKIGADGKPQSNVDGTFPLLLDSMRAGMVTEVTPTSITHWGTPEQGRGLRGTNALRQIQHHCRRESRGWSRRRLVLQGLG